MFNCLKDKLGNILNPVIPRYEKLLKLSTKEKKVGTDKDGKTIYEITVSGNYASGTILVNNVKKIISVTGSAIIANTERLVPFCEWYNNSERSATVRNISNSIRTFSKDSGVEISAQFDITIKYTKTTD